MLTRRRIYEIIEVGSPDDKVSTAYDLTMVITIVVSLIPLAFKESNAVFQVIEAVATAIFFLDYLFRWLTADMKVKKGPMSFVIYPFTLMAIIDLLAILPTFSLLAPGFRVLKLFRLLRAFRVFRIFKMFRYSHSVAIIADVIRRQREPLAAVFFMAAIYVLICALVIFNVEPDTFENFFVAVYWATVSLTTVGYGDIYPVSNAGRIFTMISAIIGIAIVALPSGIITAGYMDTIRKEAANRDDEAAPAPQTYEITYHKYDL